MVLINILGGVSLLLWGLHTVKSGVMRAFGADLHKALGRSTKNRLTAFGAGVGVTAILQSSTATALIAASFCGQGMISLSGGIAVMLGADVGTAVVAQILVLDLSWLAPLILLIGTIVYGLNQKSSRILHIGKFMVGLGLMLFALMWIRQSALPLQESDALRVMLDALDGDPIIAVLLMAVITWMMHSSLASVLLLASLVSTNVFTLPIGIAMVLGANLGGAMVPVVATLKDSKEACRIPFANLMMRMIGIVAVMPFIGDIPDWIAIAGHEPARVIVNFHMAFNVLLALAFLPFVDPVARLTRKLIMDKQDENDPGAPLYLDEKGLDTPSIALAAAMRETLRMSDTLQRMLEDTIRALDSNDEQLVNEISARDDIIDKIFEAIKLYMAKIVSESLDPNEAGKYVQILSFSTNLENAGDLIDKSLMEMTRKKIRERKKFSEEGWGEIKLMHGKVLNNMRLAQNVFVSGDRQLARRLLESKETLHQVEQEATTAHLLRIREGIPETIATSSLHLDIIRDYRRISSFMCSVAYPILRETGELRKSRLKPPKKNDKN